jgi:isochorismate synthase
MATLVQTVQAESMDRRLHEAVVRCQSKAVQWNAPALLCFSFPLSRLDPWSLWGHELGTVGTRVAWLDGAQNRCTLAAGVVDEFHLQGPERFTQGQIYWAKLAQRRVSVVLDGCSEDEAAGPLGFVGFAFDPTSKPGDERWRAWPNGMIRIPEHMVTRGSDDVVTGRVIRWVRADDKPADVVSDVRHQWTRMHGATPSAPAYLAQEPTTVALQAVETASDWVVRVAEATTSIAEQNTTADGLSKVVLARAARLQAPEGQRFDPLATVRTLRRQHPGAYCFAIEQTDGSCFVGASPETLVRVNGRHVETHALAGTAPRGADAKQDQDLGQALLESVKDRSEHAVVAHSVEASLAPLCSELHIASEPRLVRLPQVQHLATTVEGRLYEPGQVLMVAEQLHPTPAVGGWPRAAAAQWLAERESLDRGWYAGGIGWLSPEGDGVLSVAIRSALLRGAEATAFAGAGIVQASDPAAEWSETELKLSTIRTALQRGNPE